MEDANIGKRFLLGIVVFCLGFGELDSWIIALVIALVVCQMVPKKMVRKEQQKNTKSQESPKNESSKEDISQATQKKRTYSKEELQKTYHELAKKYHPDFAQGEEDKKFRTGLFTKIKGAYDRGDMETMQLYKLD